MKIQVTIELEELESEKQHRILSLLLDFFKLSQQVKEEVPEPKELLNVEVEGAPRAGSESFSI